MGRSRAGPHAQPARVVAVTMGEDDDCRVYDLLNFSSELATHHSDAAGNRALQAYIGSLISEEYDLEGTAENVTEFADFFATSPQGAVRPSVN